MASMVRQASKENWEKARSKSKDAVRRNSKQRMGSKRASFTVELVSVELTQLDAVEIKRHLEVFRNFTSFDANGIQLAQLREALEAQTGISLTAREFSRLLNCNRLPWSTEEDYDASYLVTFEEFMQLVPMLRSVYSERVKAARNVRAYFTPEQMDQYTGMFRNGAGDDGQIDASELAEFLVKYGLTVPPDKVKSIMNEVDEDKSGFLEETEFLILLIKALGVKKRKVGPDVCPLSQLAEEGWSVYDLKRAGYECDLFLAEGYTIAELKMFFDISELRQGGVSAKTLVANGWRADKAREHGFQLSDLVQAGCTVQRIREAGFTDAASVSFLRVHGIDACRMKQGGFGLLELRMAGYSSADLRVAGFAAQSLHLVDQSIAEKVVTDSELPQKKSNRKGGD